MDGLLIMETSFWNLMGGMVRPTPTCEIDNCQHLKQIKGHRPITKHRDSHRYGKSKARRCADFSRHFKPIGKDRLKVRRGLAADDIEIRTEVGDGHLSPGKEVTGGDDP